MPSQGGCDIGLREPGKTAQGLAGTYTEDITPSSKMRNSTSPQSPCCVHEQGNRAEASVHEILKLGLMVHDPNSLVI